MFEHASLIQDISLMTGSLELSRKTLLLEVDRDGAKNVNGSSLLGLIIARFVKGISIAASFKNVHNS